MEADYNTCCIYIPVTSLVPRPCDIFNVANTRLPITSLVVLYLLL